MRTTILILVLCLAACSKKENKSQAPAPKTASSEPAPKPSAIPPMDANNIVSIASNSPDHTTLVAALKAADYVASVANPGPLTVFAPTNDAFAKLPAGTVDNLLKPENLAQLQDVLKYHVAPATYEAKALFDGQVLGMANGGKVTIHKQGDQITVNDAHVIASIRASNGVVHVIDGVLLPPAK